MQLAQVCNILGGEKILGKKARKQNGFSRAWQ